ncbi:Germinal-center associated nuclear protein [Hypsibius exemplaris]|uniref:Germinal-center associated nuclear protein n=1 Tax=Hypsibius exemplaris TaxID=2072580 RepID=A0A1W0WMT1_HYPEX|nr:Germinal-center associated nuclear protein [Hypsibius exemplaris]
MASTSKQRELQREWNEQKSKPHPTEDEKYDLLQLRDRIIRSNRGDDEDANTDDVIITGVCPEICPEKERYERIKQGRVDSFEKRSRMIKDFSRQAADQDMPLPSDLRTPAALRDSMNFLLHKIIVDPPPNPESPSGWYDFVWRRVRAIRKEITQQRLTGPLIAGILEDITRFHIIAFHMFCEADQNQFAPKLNLENLNDCLATLARIYAGMETTSPGNPSPNVAEFRAYEMMLRVWTGTLDLVKTTAEVGKLPDTIRNSPEIRFARKVISAVNNRLFSEYIQLMRTADYVTACLMHYSLPMVQAKALSSLATASGSRSKSNENKVKVSAHFFARLLGLMTTEELVRFTGYHGLDYESGSEYVFFPLGFARGKDPRTYPRLRSDSLVEAKADGRNMVEIVAKSDFDEIPSPDVVEIDSFDEEGMYVGPNPFTVSFDQENVRDVRSKQQIPPVQKSQMISQWKGGIPVITLPRPPVPVPHPQSPRTVQLNEGPRFSRFPSLDVKAAAAQSTPVPSISPPRPSFDRKRVRSASTADDNDVSHEAESKRLHLDAQTVPQPKSPLRIPVSLTPTMQSPPAISRQTSIDLPYSQPAPRTSVTVEAVKTYPLRTHLQIIRARTVCQASASLGTVFRAWRDHATRYRRPSAHFGQIDAFPKQLEEAERIQLEDMQRLIWTKYPFRSKILSSCGGMANFTYCTLLFLFSAGRNGDKLEEWLRSKLGDPDPCAASDVRFMTYEEAGKMLRIVFARLDPWNRSALGQVKAEIDAIAPEVNATVLYALDHISLTTAKDVLRSSFAQSDLPVALFCHDDSVTQPEMEDDLNGVLLLDVYVPQLSPTVELGGILFDSILTLIERRVPTPIPQATTLLRLVSELYCSFLKLYRSLKQDANNVKNLESQSGNIWNDLVEDYFDENNVEVLIDEKRCCDRLSTLVKTNALRSFLKVEECSLWETPGVFPEVFPIGSTDEICSSRLVSGTVFAAISEKVLTVSAMATVCDPVVRQHPQGKPDFELQLMNWLEKLSDDRLSGSQSRSRSSSPRTDSDSSDRGQPSSGYGTLTKSKRTDESLKNITLDVAAVRKDAQQMAIWFAKVSRDLKKLDRV